MKILYCNKYNFDFSGTEAHLFEVMQLMRAGGHETALFSMLDDRGPATPYDKYFVPHIDFKAAEHSISQRARLAAGAIYSRDAQLRIRPMIDDFAPDVAHIRNIYHHISPSILWELRKQGVPVIYHLNDFKILCPNRNFMANGEACEKCAAGSFWRVATEGCYEGPRGASLVLAAEAYVHSWLRTYQKCVNIVLAPSEFAKRKLGQYGWQEESIVVLPHFQKISQALPSRAALNASILYFGRLSPEKGVADLLRAMKLAPHVLLNIAGEGPQRIELERLSRELGVDNVRFTGHLRGTELTELIEQSQFTVFPSKAYEILGKSILESYAWGRPVVASDLGSRRELVLHGQTGLLFPAGDVEKMAEAISSLAGNPRQAAAMGEAGMELLRERHSPEKYSLALNQVYEQVVATQSRSPRKLVAVAGPKLQVAFIGGRGVFSKYAGIETYYEEVGKRLVEQGHEVTVYCRKYFTPAIEKHAGMKIVRLPTIRSKHLDTFVHTFLSTVHATFSGCDVVHFHALGPALFSFLPRLRGKKTVVTVQGLDWQRKKWGRIASAILRLGERAAVRMPDATMVVSRTLHDYYRDHYHALTDYVPNGSDVRSRGKSTHLTELGLKPGDYILFLGRLSPEKNCHLLIEAFQRIDTPHKLVLAGGSSYSDRYAKRIRKQASDQVRILDWVAGPARDELIANALVFVLPSDLEGLSVALLEAMGAGVCVLTSDIPENREVVDGAGFTFKRGNVVDLERMLQLLLLDAPVRKAAARRGQQRVRDRYLWRNVAEDVGRVYQKVMQKEDREELVADHAA
ncbi:MAG TPA: glycosyltransferase family 4 protein [Terriglobales bacterium]|jgi:glycosyltransferase involved in cell wall biosynthesis|nr:glycosyltransferase family 4 protein [Terriglobales bacterium]